MLLEQERHEPWELMPHTFAHELSERKWIPYDYLVFLSHLILRLLGDGGARILITSPPRHGKSMFTSQWLPAWFLRMFPEQKVMLATYEAMLAASWGRKVREILKVHYPELLNPRTTAAALWETSQGGGMSTAGVGGPITGKGFHLGIIDDPHKNWKEAMSAAVRRTIQEWFGSTFYTRQEPPDASIVINHTRWCEDDLIGWILKNHSDSWILIDLPAIAEEDDVMGRVPGEALCPQRFPLAKLERIKQAMAPAMWNGLYQQHPTVKHGEIIERDWWNTYSIHLARPRFVVQSWDTAYSEETTQQKVKTDKSAYTVCQTWGWDGQNHYLLDEWRKRVSYPDLKDAVSAQAVRWNPNAILIEDRASGTSLCQDLIRTTSLPVIAIPIERNESKEVRAMVVSPTIRAGRCWLPANSAWIEDWLDEVTAFPNGSFKDRTDAMTQYLNYMAAFSGESRIIPVVGRRISSMLEGYR